MGCGVVFGTSDVISARRYCLALVADKYVPLVIVLCIEFAGKINAAKINDVEIWKVAMSACQDMNRIN